MGLSNISSVELLRHLPKQQLPIQRQSCPGATSRLQRAFRKASPNIESKVLLPTPVRRGRKTDALQLIIKEMTTNADNKLSRHRTCEEGFSLYKDTPALSFANVMRTCSQSQQNSSTFRTLLLSLSSVLVEKTSVGNMRACQTTWRLDSLQVPWYFSSAYHSLQYPSFEECLATQLSCASPV